ncbi:MAG: SCO1664 family protein [Nocardioidaceae bacterium]
MPADRIESLLSSHEVAVEGRLVQASNATFFGHVGEDDDAIPCVYKPVRGERPLWDFPEGTLAGREVATYAVNRLAGWDVVPVTVMGDGPFGPGMVQQWIEEDPDKSLVDLVPPGAVPDGWRHVLDAYDQRDRPIALVHADEPQLRRLALLDIVVNNADRKGGHVLVDADGHVRGCDHGLTFHLEHKLRTVLWGWAGEAFTDDECGALHRLADALSKPATQQSLQQLVAGPELTRVRRRVRRLLTDGTFPVPGGGWPSIPWPAF